MTKPLRHLVSKVLERVAELAAKMPKNQYFHAYTLTNGTTKYMTRVKFPRVFGRRVMLHRIWRADLDRELHNHPWTKAFSFIITGSYIEERLAHPAMAWISWWGIEKETYRVNWFNSLFKEDFHKITEIEEPLWTFFIHGERKLDKNGVEWGFLMISTLSSS